MPKLTTEAMTPRMQSAAQCRQFLAPFCTSLKTHGASAALLLAPFIWFSFLNFPQPITDLELDSSWGQAIGYFLKHNLQAGVDYVFTYGPLGYFGYGTFDSDLFWFSYYWELITKLVMVIVLMSVSRHSPNVLYRLAFLLAAMLLLLPWALDCFYEIMLLCLGIAVVKRSRPSLLVNGLACLVLAGVSLIKFTFLLDSLLIAVLLDVNYRSRRGPTILSPFLFYILFLLLAWVSIHQPTANLPVYLWTSLQITAGYASAMAEDSTWFNLILGLALFLLLSVAIWLFGWPKARTIGALSMVGLFQVVLFRFWKYGFTRVGPGHTGQFYTVALFLALLLPICFSARSMGRLVLACVCALSAVVGVCQYLTPSQLVFSCIDRIADNPKNVLEPLTLHEAFQRRWSALAHEWELPAIRATAQQDAVDMFSDQQAVVFLNNLNYRPRPVFQSYSAYTPALLRMNADFFLSDRAPKYVVFKLSAIDERLPASEDSQALLELLKRYYPVLVEKGFILLKRSEEDRVAKPIRQEVREQRIKLNQEISIDQRPSQCQTISIKIVPTVWGVLRQLFYQPAKVFINLRLAGGESATFRLIPSMVQDEFLLNPLLTNRDDVLALYKGSRGKQVMSFSITSAENAALNDDIVVTIKSFSCSTAKQPDWPQEDAEHPPSRETSNREPSAARCLLTRTAMAPESRVNPVLRMCRSSWTR